MAIFITFYAQPPAGYYDAAIGQTGSQLKTALFNIIKNPNVLSYDGLWNAFKDSDKDLYYENDGTVLDIYSEKPATTDPYNFTFSTDQCGTYNGEGDCYNREHSFPKSWFNDASPMYSDLFHLYPTDGYVNGRRGNLPYGKVNSPTWTSLNGGKLGANSTPGYSSNVFEPIDEFKGDLARTYFYMVTCYQDKLSAWTSCPILDLASNNGTYPSLAQWVLDLFIEWHTQDPVSQKEIDRNNTVYGKQGNRNPFIDHPEWVYDIWGGSSSVANPSNFTATAQSTTSIMLSWNLNSSNNPVVLAYNTTNTFGTPTGSYTAGQSITGGGTVVYVGSSTSFTHSGLSQQTYYYKIWSNNSGTYSSGTAISATPLLNEPSNYPTNFVSTQQTATTITLSWTDATGSVLPISYYIKAAPDGQPITLPVDGVPPVLDDLNFVASYGDQTITFENLTPNTTYNFAIFPFNNTGTNTDYKTDGNFPTTTASTTYMPTDCGSESFANIPASSSQYLDRTWTGDNGGTWTSTAARTDITINGKAICFKGYCQSNSVAGGIGSLTVTTKFPFSDGTSTLAVFVNDLQVGTVPISTSVQTTTLTGINVAGNVQIKIASDGSKRAAIDDVSWTCYLPQSNIVYNQDYVRLFPNPVENGYLYIETNTSNSQIIEIYNIVGNKLIQQQSNQTFNTINVSQLKAGIYFCVVKSSNNLIINKFVVK